MSNMYIIDTNTAISHMYDAIKNMMSEYGKKGINIDGHIDGYASDSVTRSNLFLPVKYLDVTVAAKRLFDNVQYDCVRSQDLVYCMHDIFHEERHVYQKSVLYKDKNASQKVVDMAKCDIVSGILPEYERYVYHQKPSEIDADSYGWQKAIEYFDTHFLDRNGHPLIDARKEMMDELFDMSCNSSYEWFGNKYAGSYKSAMESLEEARDVYKNSAADFFARPWQKNSETYKRLVTANRGLYAYSYVNAKTPEEAHQVLYEFAVDTGNVSTLAFPCLKKSVADVKSGKRIVVPAMSRLEQAKYNPLNLVNLARAENLRHQDVYNRMSDVPSRATSQRSSVNPQPSREASLNRLMRNIDYPDTQSDHDHDHEHNGLS